MVVLFRVNFYNKLNTLIFLEVIMKQLKNLMLCSITFLAMTITGCGNNNSGDNGPAKREGPIVFVMSGQSNMEGNTNFGTSGSDKKAYIRKYIRDDSIKTRGQLLKKYHLSEEDLAVIEEF